MQERRHVEHVFGAQAVGNSEEQEILGESVTRHVRRDRGTAYLERYQHEIVFYIRIEFFRRAQDTLHVAVSHHVGIEKAFRDVVEIAQQALVLVPAEREMERSEHGVDDDRAESVQFHVVRTDGVVYS